MIKLEIAPEDVDAVVEALNVRAAIVEAEAAKGFVTEYPVARRLRLAAQLRQLADKLDHARLDYLCDKLG